MPQVVASLDRAKTERMEAIKSCSKIPVLPSGEVPGRTGPEARPSIPLDRPRSRVWLKRVMILWIVLLVAVSVKTLTQNGQRMVYPVFFEGARDWWRGAPVYEQHLGMDRFRYTPTFALLVSPFAAWPDRLGGILWHVASVVAVVAGLRCLARHVIPGGLSQSEEPWFFALVLVNSVRGIWSGHNNAFLLAAILFAAAAVARKQWWRAALLLALPVFIKLWPLALMMLLAACWPRQLIGRFLVVVAALAAAPLLTQSPSLVLTHYRDWIGMLRETSTIRWPGYCDAWTMWESLGLTVNAHVYLGVQLAGALAALAWCVRHHRRSVPSEQSLMGICAAWVCWQLLLGPGVEKLTYLVIAPFTSWAVVESFRRRERRGLAVAAWLMTGLAGTGEVTRLVSGWLPLASATLPLGVAVMAIWVIAAPRRPTDEAGAVIFSLNDARQAKQAGRWRAHHAS